MRGFWELVFVVQQNVSAWLHWLTDGGGGDGGGYSVLATGVAEAATLLAAAKATTRETMGL